MNTVTPSRNGAVGLVPACGLPDINSTLRIAKQVVFRLNLNNITHEHYFTKRLRFIPDPECGHQMDGLSPASSASGSDNILLLLVIPLFYYGRI